MLWVGSRVRVDKERRVLGKSELREDKQKHFETWEQEKERAPDEESERHCAEEDVSPIQVLIVGRERESRVLPIFSVLLGTFSNIVREPWHP